MIRTLAIAAGLAVGVSSAQAAFTGILMQEDAARSAAASVQYGTATTVLRVWAMFDGPGSQVASPGGNSNLVLNTFGVDINLDPLGPRMFAPGGALGITPNGGIIPGDFSFGTIGAENFDALNPIAIDPGTSITNFNFGNGGGFRNDNPPNGHGEAGFGPQPVGSPDFGLLLFQLVIKGDAADGSFNTFGAVNTGIFLDQNGNKVTDTFVDGFGILSGTFNVAVRDPQTPLTHRIQFGSAPAVPTPGSLALFGLAGLAAARRRR